MRDLYVSLVYLSFLVLGVSAPFVFSLGYVWVDVFYPQYLTDTLIHFLPVSLIMGIAAVGGYLLLDRRAARVSPVMVLTVIFAVWITLTALWAQAPDTAWTKWNWATKTVIFSAFIPLVIRSRVQIEAFILVWVFAAAAHLLPVGIKTFVSGGGYGIELGLLRSNASGLSESSEVSAVAIMFIPIVLALRTHSLLLGQRWLRDGLFYAMAFLFVFTAVGTFARTAIIGFAVVGATMWLRSRRKVLFTLVALVMAGGVIYKSSAGWEARISTIQSYDQESSAYTRILIWQWTWGFVQEHPFGGGFNTYVVNRIEIPGINGGPPSVEFGRAFHSSYFEVLGEHGYPGFLLFIAIVGLSLQALWRTTRLCRGIPGLLWCQDLAGALLTALLTLLACAAFIGVAFQPMFWYMFALSTALRGYALRALRDDPERATRRLLSTANPGAVPGLPGLSSPGVPSGVPSGVSSGGLISPGRRLAGPSPGR